MPSREPIDPSGGGAILPGTRVGRYEVLGEIGRGGMGVVYRAVDVDLGRLVALKSPRDDALRGPKLRERFMREARTASRLSHPNVVPVFEVFEHGERPWLATEFVDGRDLRSILREDGALPVEDAVRHAEGLSDALAAAHAKNILHRDIKPSNVLVGQDGRARLADFGLARAPVLTPPDSALPTASESLTSEGLVAGTPGYMSPEQALGKPLDARSDIFCLGAVIYELCAGRPAFPAARESDWLDKLLHYDPPSIARLNSDVPAELERIVRKAMAKRPDERYQHASDMHADLVALRRRLESGSVEASLPTSRSRKALAWTIGVVALLLAAAGIASRVPRIIRGIQSDQKGVPTMVPRRLTSSPGWCRQPAISPDGSLIAYTSNASGNADIWVVDVRGGAPLRLTNDPGADEEPTWYPDGSTIAFVSDRDGTRSVWKVPRLGGSAVMVVADACAPAISPDGRRIAFSRSRGASSKRIEVAPLDDVANSVVLTRDEDGLWDHLRPAWSPDSRTLCYQDFRDLWIVPSDGGRARRLTEDHQTSQNCAWSADGETVYFSSMRESTTALWRMPATGGKPTRLTPGTGPETEPSISKDGSKLTHSTFYSDADVVLIEAASGKRTRSPCPSIEDAPAVAPDRSAVAFSSMRSGKPDLWLQPLENDVPKGDAVRLTDQPGSAGSPSFSPDGRWIAYTRVVGGERDIWIVPTRGGVPERFTDHAAVDIHPAWSPDGTQIAFSSSRSGSEHIWVAPVRDGKPAGELRPVTSGATADLFPGWSPDGRMIVFIGQRGPDSEAWVARCDGSGAPLRVTQGAHAERALWIGDSPDLLVSGTWGAGRMEIRRVLVPGGEFVPGSDPIVIGDADALGEFTVSRDGRLLAVIEHVARGELWVLEAPPGSF